MKEDLIMINYSQIIKKAQQENYYLSEEHERDLIKLLSYFSTKKDWYIRELPGFPPQYITCRFINEKGHYTFKDINLQEINVINFNELKTYINNEHLEIGKIAQNPLSLLRHPDSFMSDALNTSMLLNGYMIFQLNFGELVTLLKEREFTHHFLMNLDFKAASNFTHVFVEVADPLELKGLLPRIKPKQGYLATVVIPISISEKIKLNKYISHNCKQNKLKLYSLENQMDYLNLHKHARSYIRLDNLELKLAAVSQSLNLPKSIAVFDDHITSYHVNLSKTPRI